MIIASRRGRRRTGRLFAAGLALVVLASSAPAFGDERADRAEALFQRAREQMSKGDFASACPMLETAYSIDHGAGTLLALAICHEGNGQLATALREYRESLSLAVRLDRSDRVMLAEQHVQQLEARVPRVQIVVPTPEAPNLAVAVDGAPVDRATMLAGVPVDPGKHVVDASTPRAPAWRTEVSVAAGGGSVVVHIPAFGSPLSGGAPPAAGMDTAKPMSALAVIGWSAVALGAVGLGAGTFFGVSAFVDEGRSKAQCNNGSSCPSTGYDLNHQASSDATLSDVSFAVGGVALAAGILLLVGSSGRTEPAKPAPVSFLGFAGADRCGIGVRALW
jgi:hypothetical protein